MCLGCKTNTEEAFKARFETCPTIWKPVLSSLAHCIGGSISKSDRRVAPFLKQVAEKAISLGDENSVAWEALVRAYQLLGDENTAKEISDKMHALIEQGELQLSAGVRRYQGASWDDPTRCRVAK